MSSLANLVQQLKQERDQAQKTIAQLNEALNALTGVARVGGIKKKRSPAMAPGKRRTMSPAARKRIAAAQRARWAKWKRVQRRK